MSAPDRIRSQWGRSARRRKHARGSGASTGDSRCSERDYSCGRDFHCLRRYRRRAWSSDRLRQQRHNNRRDQLAQGSPYCPVAAERQYRGFSYHHRGFERRVDQLLRGVEQRTKSAILPIGEVMDMADQIWNRIESARENARLARSQERGVALLMTIFGLLLLTAVAMAMMFASDAETAISVNYRDSQVASYSAASALQEARDRIQPLNGDLAVAGYLPTNTPDQGIANGGYVLYILNPGSNETVASIAPWNWNNGSNQYFDQE